MKSEKKPWGTHLDAADDASLGSRAKLMGDYLSTLFDAIGPNKAGLSLVQRILFIVWPASFILPLAGYRLAQDEKLVQPFQAFFASMYGIALIILVWWGLTAWVFRAHLASHKWSGDISVMTRVFLILSTFALAAIGYFEFSTR